MGSTSDMNRFRSARFNMFMNLISADGDISILDIGGTVSYWKQVSGIYGVDRFKVTIVNIDQDEDQDENLVLHQGDACNLSMYSDFAFDVVHSNSVIEHVGRIQDMSRMAAEVRRLAPSYFVQTPNAGFPIEPHYKLPLVHWLPENARIAFLRRLGRVPNDVVKATAAVQRISLLNRRQMSSLFPDAEILEEKWLGLTKSLLAVRDGRGKGAVR